MQTGLTLCLENELLDFEAFFGHRAPSDQSSFFYFRYVFYVSMRSTNRNLPVAIALNVGEAMVSITDVTV